MSDAVPVHKTFTYNLKPTPAQEQALAAVVWHGRALDNTAREQRTTWWERWARGQDTRATSYQPQAELPDLKVACPDYAEINAQVVQEVLVRVERAFQACFRRGAAGETPGSPRFPGWGRYTSCTAPQVGEQGGARLENGLLVLSTIGRIAVRWSRPLAGTPKTVTISQAADGWYACFSCAEVPVQPLAPTGQETGRDVGLQVVLIAADGETVATPRQYRTAERRLAKAQRRVSRRTQGSPRRRKAVARLKRTHHQVQRQRRDCHHTTALALLRRYDVIELEELRVRNLVKNPYLAKSSSAAGGAAFRTILDAKAVCAGRQVIAVPPADTSQDCSGVVPDGRRGSQRGAKSRSVRPHVCPSCGLVLDREEHAARTMLRAGQAPQALTQRGAAYVA